MYLRIFVINNQFGGLSVDLQVGWLNINNVVFYPYTPLKMVNVYGGEQKLNVIQLQYKQSVENIQISIVIPKIPIK
ncbi:hypothetical protein pb186bvf_008142 [Paramecium bursaria]